MCGKIGALVSSKTVSHLVYEDVSEKNFAIEIFSLCVDPSCEMAYYSADYGYLYLSRDVAVPLDYKDGVDVSYLCYCNQITKAQVRQMVAKNPDLKVKEVFSARGKILTEKCKLENPFGYCCLPDIHRYIEDVVAGRETI